MTTGERLHLAVIKEAMEISRETDPSRRGTARMGAKAFGEIELHVISVAM